MKKSRFTEEHIIDFLKQAETGMPIKELCRNGGFSDATFYKWGAPSSAACRSRRHSACVSSNPRTPISCGCRAR
jgi:hypothetical protein